MLRHKTLIKDNTNVNLRKNFRNTGKNRTFVARF